MTERITHKTRFLQYRDDGTIVKSRRYAYWTLPQLMAEVFSGVGMTTSQISRDFQEIGALLVNNLSAKLAALLFPSNRPFFKVDLSAQMLAHAAEKGKPTAVVNAGLARMEMEASQRLFLNASYNQLVMALKHLMVTGNVLIHRDKQLKRTTCYGLQSFSTRRDGRGQLVDLIVKESTSFVALSRELQAAVRSRNPVRYSDTTKFDISIELYTRVVRETLKNGNVVYKESQEVEGIEVGTPATHPEHLCPWTAPTWSIVAGEHYGRGLVEDFAGGFAKLSDASEALALYGISAMKFVNLVAPGQGANIDELQAAETGEYVQGSKDTISVHETGDANKIVAMRAEIEAVFGNLARAFMYKGNTRQAERVTAFELQQDATEANTVLGGTYSSLAESVQVPLAHVLLTEVEPGTLQGIISGDMKLNLMAGIPALGRAADVQNIIAAARDASAIAGVLGQIDRRIDMAKLMDVIYAGASVDTSVFFLSEAEIQKLDAAKNQEQAGIEQIEQTQDLASQQAALQALG